MGSFGHFNHQVARTTTLCTPSAHYKFDQAIDDEADPGVYEDSEVESKWLVASGRRQVRHEDEEVEQAADEDSGKLLEESGEQSAPEICA